MSVHGTTETIRKIDRTKNIRMRTDTEIVIRAIVLAPASDSAAASVAISAPHSEKMVVATPAKMAATPAGAKPPWAVRLAKTLPDGAVRPYVGAGVNYTRFYSVNLGGGTLDVDNSSWGGALQAGADIPINKTFFFNIDVKKIWIDTDVKVVATGATAANFKINPVVIGLGVGMKF